jgi:hypothetical protein
MKVIQQRFLLIASSVSKCELRGSRLACFIAALFQNIQNIHTILAIKPLRLENNIIKHCYISRKNTDYTVINMHYVAVYKLAQVR